MNAERKRLVQTSWNAIAPNHDRAASRFYERLFENDPGTRALFGRTDMTEQRVKFVTMVTGIVRHLDLPKNLIPLVSALGRRHVDYGVRPIHYDRVREALFGALAEELGDRFTDDVRDAWEEAYALLAGVMLRGAETLA